MNKGGSKGYVNNGNKVEYLLKNERTGGIKLMNLSDSKKKLALAGVVCGIVAACLAALGNPANMAFVLLALSEIQRVQWECIRQKWYSMQDQRLLALCWEHLSFL